MLSKITRNLTFLSKREHMYRGYITFFLSFFFSLECSETLQTLVTYEFSGRLGDSLLSYSHAQWFAYKRGFCVLYHPFPYADRLHLSKKLFSLEKFSTFKRLKRMQRISSLDDRVYKSICYIPYFSDFECEKNKSSDFIFDVDWEDEAFHLILTEHICPLEPLELIHPKENLLNVAMHVRTTGAFDPKGTENHFPEKFPPLEFYEKAILSLCEKNVGSSIHVQLFTDYLNPEELLDHFTSLVPKNVTISWKKFEKNPVLSDFFSISLFPIIIRGESNFSFIAAKIGNPDLEIYPEKIDRTDGIKIIYKKSKKHIKI